MSAFEDPSIKSAVGELEAAEAFFSNDDNAFDDPPALAAGIDDDEAAMAPYRRGRDEIRQAIIDLFTEREIDCTS